MIMLDADCEYLTYDCEYLTMNYLYYETYRILIIPKGFWGKWKLRSLLKAAAVGLFGLDRPWGRVASPSLPSV